MKTLITIAAVVACGFAAHARVVTNDLGRVATTAEVSGAVTAHDTDARHVVDGEKAAWNAKYAKPSGGIPKTDLASAVQTSLGKADAADANADAKVSAHNTDARHIVAGEKDTWNAKYDKPSGGIPKTDLAQAVQTSLGKADSALQDEEDPVWSSEKSLYTKRSEPHLVKINDEWHIITETAE